MTNRRLRVFAFAATVVCALLVTPLEVADAQSASGGTSGAAANAADTAAIALAAGPQAAGTTATPVTMSLVSTAPIAPPVQAADTAVTVSVLITNNSDAALQQVQLRALRDSPIIRPGALDGMLANPVEPADASLTQTLPTQKYGPPIAAHSSVELSYQFTASSLVQNGSVCLCQTGIYPIDLSAYAASNPRSAPAKVAWTQTYLVSVASTPATEQVSWLWPLIDRPHRMSDTGPFIDDQLAGEVASGGRLDRALQVLEQVDPASRVTVVIDPELIDELVQMSSDYRVQTGASVVTRPASSAAADWLQRLRAVIANRPIALTPYGDPAVDAVAAANLDWQSTLPAAMATRVDTALGRPVDLADSALAWPPGSTLTPAALQQLAAGGATTVVVNDSTLPANKTTSPPVGALASIPVPGTAGSSIHALVTSTALEQRVDGLLNSPGSQLAGLPALLAELSLRTLPSGAGPSSVVLTPDRYVDTNPAVAAAVIGATTTASWASPLAAGDAAAVVSPADHGTLTAPDAEHLGGSSGLIALAASTQAFAANFGTVLAPADAATLLASYPSGVQLAESAGWTGAASAANTFATVLRNRQTQLAGQVQIVRPANGSYSLASSSAPLLVTVVNNLAVPVTVRIGMNSVGGVAGFRIDDAGQQVIAADSRRTIKLQAHVARSGHFRVQAQLLMPNGAALGPVLPLSIYSSALGTLGVVITIVAAAILLLALIHRFFRRWRHHRALIARMMTQDQQPVPAGARG